MNFLAHAFLVAPDADLQIGGFLGDFVRGRSFAQNYPPRITEGIWLHRHIDTFTDNSRRVRACNALFRPTQGKYASVLTDIFFDHLLARNWDRLTSVAFSDFITNFYAVLAESASIFPNDARYVQRRMREYDWLGSYGSAEGVQRALRGLSRRVRFENRIAEAWADFEANEQAISEHFMVFLPEVQAFVNHQIQQIAHRSHTP